MMDVIRSINALEILDSRGIPTLEVEIGLDNGVYAAASVPAGESTGTHEAVELRDGDLQRYGGLGVRQAVENVRTKIAPHIIGRSVGSHEVIDKLLLELDGTPNKSGLGANAILAVSMAAVRAAAQSMHVPIYTYLARGANELPMPMFNILNGGKHTDSSVDVQEFMIVPVGAPSFAEGVRYASETFYALHSVLKSGGLATSLGEEGGFAPDLPNSETACELIVQAIEKAGYKPGDDISIALDMAASSFYDDGYHLGQSEGVRTTAELIDMYKGWVHKYPIISIEDGLAESDWVGFRDLTAALCDTIQIVGDDIYVTNVDFIQRGIAEQCSNAALIKLNQIGTVSEAIDAVELCRKANWAYVISHRAGETEDTFLADFAVAMGGGQIKAGSVSRGERVAKYNRLLRIEHERGSRAALANPFNKR